MKDEETKNSVSKIEQQNASFDANIMAFEKVKQLAEYLSTSDTFTKGFEQRDKGGVILNDEKTGRPLINTADIAIALMVGHNLGLDLASSLVIGSKLNQKTYLAILKGRELGFGIATSMEKIYSITAGGNIISYTGVDIISAKLIQGGVNINLVKQNAPFHVYYDMVTKEELDLDQILDENDNLKPEYFLYVNNVTKAEILKQKLDDGTKVVTKVRRGEYSKVIMTRVMPNGTTQIIKRRFSTVDAEKAGLLPTFNAQGQQLTGGKDNWIKSTGQMLDNRCISIAGRIIGADLIQGLYTVEEVKEIPDVKVEDVTHQEV